MSNQERSLLRRVAKSSALRIQETLHLEPRTFCLVTGPPRSGTTAVGRWLLGHDHVVGLNESRILVAAHHLVSQIHRFQSLHLQRRSLEELARRWALGSYGAFGLVFGARALVDKEPLEPIAFPDKDYSAFLKNIRGLFPSIRLLFIIRDPVPTLWSMTQRKWGKSLRGVEPFDLSMEEHIENWCANVDLALEYAGDPGAYLCSFRRLVTEPALESRRILEFLGLKDGRPFEPRPTKEVGFNPEALERIREATVVQVKAMEEWEARETNGP